MKPCKYCYLGKHTCQECGSVITKEVCKKNKNLCKNCKLKNDMEYSKEAIKNTKKIANKVTLNWLKIGKKLFEKWCAECDRPYLTHDPKSKYCNIQCSRIAAKRIHDKTNPMARFFQKTKRRAK